MSEKRDRGWEYLNSSNDEDFDYDPDGDGSWGFQNDDGSGSYYGADGSWGLKMQMEVLRITEMTEVGAFVMLLASGDFSYYSSGDFDQLSSV